MYVVSVVCCQVEVFPKGRSLAQRSLPIVCMCVIELIRFNNNFLHYSE